MSGSKGLTAVLCAGLMVGVAGCTQSTNVASVTPTPVESATPSSSPSSTASATATPASMPSAAPSPSPTPAKLIITALTYHVGEATVAYAPVAAGASGGIPPYTWSVGGGALPPALALSKSGTLSGTPTTPGSYDFVILLQDSGGQAAGVARSITIVPYLTASFACGRICNAEVGCAGACADYLVQNGGVAPYRYQLASGFLPAGTSLGASLAGRFMAA